MVTYDNCPMPVRFPTDGREVSVGRIVVELVAELPWCVRRFVAAHAGRR